MTGSQAHISERDVRTTKVHAIRNFGIVPYAQKFDKQSMIGALVSTHGAVLQGDNPFRDINDIIT